MWFDPSNTTMQQDNIFKKHLIENELLNPVVGFRFGPPNAKMTVGALDQADYEGVLNWVPATGVSQVNIDGFYGKNGSRIPYITPLKADLSSGELAYLRVLPVVDSEFDPLTHCSHCGSVPSFSASLL